MLTGNKGEWSEVYALIKLMTDGQLFQSDINLNVDAENMYDVIAAYKKDVGYDLTFERNEGVKVFKIEGEEKTLIAEKSYADFENLSYLLLSGIRAGSGKTFKLPSVNPYFDELQIAKVQAGANTKADLRLRIYDHRLAKEADLGFSIKSLIGSKSTLFNPDIEGNFIFEVTNFDKTLVEELNVETYNPLGNVGKLTARINQIEKEGGKFKFLKIQSSQLWKNLKMVDGDMPEIIGWALYYRWRERKSLISDVVNILEQEDPLNFYDDETSSQRMYEYKMKKFLVDSAMGMTTQTAWHGEYDSFGGVIVVKKDGDLVCFHVYDVNLFRNYLLNNTFFEQPATGENGDDPGHANPSSGKTFNYGWLYEEDNKCYFKINLQVRFTK